MDYKSIGLKAGLECHQQLNTKKLFCNCESETTEEAGDFLVHRKLRPVVSETGEFDKAALQEYKKMREYIYEGFYKNTCLVELDEEPPHRINNDALKTVLEVATKTNSDVFDTAFVMRKIVIDGSNTSGFQRTALIAQNGFLNVGPKKVRVSCICLEEDAAKQVETTLHYIKYKLDRLGIPLIEFTTEPDLETPEEVKKCAEKIGELFRITGRAKRGLGSIRQDVNISIKDGARVEIKGVQYLDLIDKYVEIEANRQLKLIEIKNNLHKAHLQSKQKLIVWDITSELEKSESKRIKESISKGLVALAFVLQGFKGILGTEIQPNKRVGTEISGYVKAKTKALGLLHSDELPNYGIGQNVVDEIKEKLKMQKEDAFIIIVEDKKTVETAIKVAFERAMELFEGVPKETRNPLPDGTTEYSRPLPGAARMYPETDIPPIEINKTELLHIKNNLPMWYSERLEKYQMYGLNKQMSEAVAKSNYAKDFESLLGKYNIISLCDFFAQLPEKYNLEKYLWILDAEKEEKINRKDLHNAIQELQKGKTKEEILLLLLKSELDSATKNIILTVLNQNKDFIKQKGENALNPMMGSCMKEILAKTGKKPDMKQLSDFIKEEIKK